MLNNARATLCKKQNSALPNLQPQADGTPRWQLTTQQFNRLQRQRKCILETQKDNFLDLF